MEVYEENIEKQNPFAEQQCRNADASFIPWPDRAKYQSNPESRDPGTTFRKPNHRRLPSAPTRRAGQWHANATQRTSAQSGCSLPTVKLEKRNTEYEKGGGFIIAKANPTRFGIRARRLGADNYYTVDAFRARRCL